MAIDRLAAELESVGARRTDLEEEHNGEEGAFSDFDKVNKAGVIARLKEINGDPDSEDKQCVLKNWIEGLGDIPPPDAPPPAPGVPRTWGSWVVRRGIVWDALNPCGTGPHVRIVHLRYTEFMNRLAKISSSR